MKIILSSLIALSVLATIGTTANAATDARGFYDQLERQQN
jgi:hypothetical protein